MKKLWRLWQGQSLNVPGARHYAWAYKLMDGRERFSDDGEPRIG